MLAASNGHTNMVEILLQHKANVDMQNEVSIVNERVHSVFRNVTSIFIDYMCV